MNLNNLIAPLVPFVSLSAAKWFPHYDQGVFIVLFNVVSSM